MYYTDGMAAILVTYVIWFVFKKIQKMKLRTWVL